MLCQVAVILHGRGINLYWIPQGLRQQLWPCEGKCIHAGSLRAWDNSSGPLKEKESLGVAHWCVALRSLQVLIA